MPSKVSGQSSAVAPSVGEALVENDFVPIRAKLLEVAAFLDRVERYGVAGDFRCDALRQAVDIVADGKPERARRILELLSDPTKEPVAASTGKAVGAWKRS